MAEYLPAAKVSEIPDPGRLLVELDDRLIVVLHAAGSFYALDDFCTHDGGPLSDGELDTEDLSIACPRHGAKFSLRDGAAMTMPAIQATVSHEVKIEDDTVMVKLNDS